MVKITFPPSQLGVNMNLRTHGWYGLSLEDMTKYLFDFPYANVRIPIPINDVSPKKGVWDFSKKDKLIDQALKRKKKIHLQLGIKTIGWPEVHLPRWLTSEFPYCLKPKVCVDKEKKVQELTFTYLEQCAKRYFPIKEIISLQIENEPYSRGLQVSNYRYISMDFNKKEVEFIKKRDKYKRPHIQNTPWDTPLTLLHALTSGEILGLNIYNQTTQQFIPELFNSSWLQTYLTGIKTLNVLLKKRIYVTEYQTASWLTAQKTPKYPFKTSVFLKGLEHLKAFNPEVIFFWDLEQWLWKKDKEFIRLLNQLVQ